MITVQSFVFSPFFVNTYILYDETRQCVIIDPGCYEEHEKEALQNFIKVNELNPVKLLNTHCHIDHVFGNGFVVKTFGVSLEIHEADIPTLKALLTTAELYSIPNVEASPEPAGFLEEGDVVEFGSSKLDILHVPGHCPGHLAFVNHEQQFVIQGDVLFQGSIGRSDLPGGDHDTLITNIKTKLLPLGDEFKVYSGHGDPTTIGIERQHNPFLNQQNTWH